MFDDARPWLSPKKGAATKGREEDLITDERPWSAKPGKPGPAKKPADNLGLVGDERPWSSQPAAKKPAAKSDALGCTTTLVGLLALVALVVVGVRGAGR